MKGKASFGGAIPQVVATLMVAYFAASSVHAEGFRNPPPGAAGLGRSGVWIAQSDDASAVSYNPANLVDVDGASVVAGFSLASTKTEFDSASGVSAESEDPWQILPNLYGACPMQDQRMALGIGITTPYGQSMEWDESGPFRYDVPYFAEIRLVNVNPSIGYKINEALSVGAGLDVFVSDLEFKQCYPWALATGNPAAPDGVARFTGDGSGLGGNVGLTWKITGAQRVALVYRSSVKVDYDGDFEISNLPASAAPFPALATVSPESDFSTEIEYPAAAGLGYGVALTETLNVEADVEWLEWSRYDRMALDIAGNQALLPAPEIVNDWDDSWTFGLSADWHFAPEWVFRAGYSFLESPIPDETFSPSIPDADRHVVTFGLGYGRGGHAIQVAMANSFYEDREIGNNQNPTYNGDYELCAQLYSVSYGYSF